MPWSLAPSRSSTGVSTGRSHWRLWLRAYTYHQAGWHTASAKRPACRLRRYVLWCRLRTAAEAAMRGASLTEAAHRAGCADSAHLSRTFRAMLGVAPSLLFKPGQASVTFCETAAST